MKTKLLVLVAIVAVTLVGCSFTPPSVSWTDPAPTLAPKAQGCTASAYKAPDGSLLTFEGDEITPDGKWQCVAKSPEGPFSWKPAPKVSPTEVAKKFEDAKAPVAPAATATPTLVPIGGQPVTTTVQTGGCVHDNSTTAFPSRDSLVVNGVETRIQVRDARCPRAIFHEETGVNKGANFRVIVPKSWTLAVAAVSCQVVPAGGKPTDYKDTPFLLIKGPWAGELGCFEAGLHGTVAEWEFFLTEVIHTVHQSEVGHPVPITILGGK